jgi:biotin synthase-related radical SAM superfamily protein
MAPKIKTQDVDRPFSPNFMKRAEECRRAAKNSLSRGDWNAATICVISDNYNSRLTTIKIPVSRVHYPGSFGRRPGWFKIVKSGNCTC